jgi:stage II sporulation protein D
MLIFRGRGYGHGVGLCQEGAIRMAEIGFDYHDIIKHYYSGVEIVNYLELRNLLQDFTPGSD